MRGRGLRPIGARPARAALLALALVPAAAGGAMPAPAFTLEAAPAVPWAFCAATARGADGLSGTMRLYGVDRDGSRAQLFQAAVEYADELTIRYWADDDLAAIVAELETPSGELLEAGVDFAYSERKDGAAAMLAGLTFPFREMPLGEAPAAAELPGNDPVAAARVAANRLFAAGRNPAALAAPAAWAVLALILGCRPAGAKARRGRSAVPALAAAAAAAMLAAVLAGAPARLFVLDLPGGDGSFTAGLEREGADGRETLRWSSPGGGGTLSFMAILPSRAAGIDLDAFGRYRRVRFARPPLVVLGLDGAYRVTAGGYLAAWGLRDE